MSVEDRLSSELLALLGERDFLRLVEAYGGTRLLVPNLSATESLVAAIGAEAVRALQSRHAQSTIRVPLARALRARHYRAKGASNAEIARRLGITETGVDKLFGRMKDRPAKGSSDPRQADFFARR